MKTFISIIIGIIVFFVVAINATTTIGVFVGILGVIVLTAVSLIIVLYGSDFNFKNKK